MKLRADDKDVPKHMEEPTLEALLELRQDARQDTRKEEIERLHAFTFFVEHILPQVIGKFGWREEMCSKRLSDTDITASDEAFALLCCLNMWDKWHGESGPTNRGIYTAKGSNKKYCGWTAAGLKKYNELFAKVVRNRKSEWAAGVETVVQDDLKSRYYPQTTLQDIRNKKVRKRGKGTADESEDSSSESLPRMAWDVESVEV